MNCRCTKEPLAAAGLNGRPELSLILPGEQHIAETTLHEGGHRLPCAGIEKEHMLLRELRHEFLRLGIVAVVGGPRPSPGGEEVPARATRGLSDSA